MDKKQLTYHEYDLDRSAVDEISTAVQEYLSTNETDGRSILKIRRKRHWQKENRKRKRAHGMK